MPGLSDDEILARVRASTERRKKAEAGEAVAVDDSPQDHQPVDDAPGKGLGALAVQKLGITWDGVGCLPYRYVDEYRAALALLTEEERQAHWEARHNDPNDVSYRKPKGDKGVLIFLGQDGKPLDPQPTLEERAEERRQLLEERAKREQAARESVGKYMAEVRAAAERRPPLLPPADAKAVQVAGDSATRL